jgi:predicted aspartyl protease
MIIKGIIDEQNRLWVKIKVAGYHGGRDIFFRIDTAFDGELSIPVSLAVPLGLPLVGESEYSIGGGGISRPFKFIVSIQWGSQNRLATADVDQTKAPLLGMGLLNGYILLADFKNKTLIIKEPEEKQVGEVKKSTSSS